MESNLQKWQRSMIRDGIERYRRSLTNYYIQNKSLVELEGGQQAFSLLSPPLGSAVARRRLRFIMKNVIDANTVVSPGGAVNWGDRTPHFLTVAVTYHCQCDCRHCSAEDYKEDARRNDSALSLPELKGAIQQAVDIGTTCVIFTGGEPLLLEGIEDLIAAVDPAQAICAMFSNGEYLSLERAQRLKQAGLFGVFVSLDAADAAEHDRHRGRPGLFDHALEGIANCQQAGLLTGISTFITPENLRDGRLAAMMDLGRQLNVLELFLFDVIATGKLDGRQECMLSDADVEEVVRFRQHYNETPDYPRIIHQTMFTSIAYPCAAEGCPAGVAQIHLRGNGDVTPCDFAPFGFGNVRKRPLKEIWEGLSRHPVFLQGSKRCRLADPVYWQTFGGPS